MISLGKHRIISEIESKRQKGQILHFLTGDAIMGGDNYFYSLRYGIRSLLGTLMLFYFKETKEFDYFIYINNSGENWQCFVMDNSAEMGCKKIEFSKMLNLEDLHTCDSPFGTPNNATEVNAETPTNNKAADEAQKEADKQTSGINSLTANLNKITELIKKKQKKVLILLENMEWIANLYDEPKTSWISQLQNSIWQKSEKLLVIVTIKDMELLKKYKFPEEETFIANPTAEEILLAYWRYLIRNMHDGYRWDFKVLDDVAHSMSVGKKTLIQCIRILHNVTKSNATELKEDDFRRCAELNIEEKVLWDDVILDKAIKNNIETAVDKFLDENQQGQARKGILLTGPPGTGKTMLAKALATEKKCYFMAPTLADLKAEYVGQSSAKVKRIFAEARGNQPTILFIDEADTVFPSRDLNAMDRDSFGLDMVNQFLQEIDGAKTGTQKIFIIAATNRPMAIDSAIRSRLSGTPINIPLPDYDSRRRLFNIKLAPFTLDGKFFADDVLNKSDGMSGRDIDNITKIIKENNDIKNMGNDEITHEIFNKVFAAREQTYIRESIFSESTVIAPDENKKKFSDVIGYEDLKEEITRQAHYIMAAPEEKDSYRYFGIEPAKGILMYGPPGNAKTVLAEATAGEFGFYYIKIISQDFISSYPEQQIKRLTDIFQQVETFSKMTDASGIVLFFDEFDSLAGKSVLCPSVRGTLLTYMADMRRNKNSKVLLITATNFYSRIDDAVKRKGRLDSHLFMDNPSEENGKTILKTLFAKDEKLVAPVSDEIINKIYNDLRSEVQNNPEKKRQIMEELFGSAEIFDLLTDSKKDLIQQKLSNLRPSGADLKIKYEKLKEIAFVNKFMTAEEKQRLVIRV